MTDSPILLRRISEEDTQGATVVTKTMNVSGSA